MSDGIEPPLWHLFVTRPSLSLATLGVPHSEKVHVLLHPLLAALCLFVFVPSAGTAATADSTHPAEGTFVEIEVLDPGYDAGFDFEALGIMGTTWRLGFTYYKESLLGAQLLDAAIDSLLADPGPANLERARAAWSVARTPYLRTEVFRFILPQVAAWEGRVNAWPLDEGLIDYVDAPLDDRDNPLANANLVASKELMVNGRPLDATVLSQGVLDSLSEAGGGAAAGKNVTTGYHAIEFMLWGQDLHGTAPGAGQRPWTDFASDSSQCTNGHCERRRAYLKLVSERLVADLDEMVAMWKPGGSVTVAILSGEPHEFIERMVTGTAEFIQVELAGERMRLALTLRDPEEEHDCFSDQTHRSHYYNFEGIEAIFLGDYLPTEGLPADVVSLHDRGLVGAGEVLDLYRDPAAAKEAMAAARESLEAIKALGESGAPFDTLIAEDNPEGNQAVQQAISQLLLFSFALQALHG